MTTVVPAPRWGTINEAMAYLRVSRNTVRRMIARDEIKAKKVGPKLIRVDMTALESAGKPVSA